MKTKTDSTQAEEWNTRPYRNEDDLRAMMHLIMLGRSRSDDWHYCHIGDLVWKFFIVTCHSDPRQHIRLWHKNDELIGYAILGGDDVSLEWQVLPEHEWMGIEAEALEWGLTNLHDLRIHDAEQWAGPLRARATQDDLKRQAFFEECGFRLGEYAEMNLSCPLVGPIDESKTPFERLVESMSNSSQVADRAAIERDVWGMFPALKISDEDYRRCMHLPGYDPELDLVALAPDGVMASYVNAWIDPVNRVGDLGPVGARERFRRQGYTRAVLRGALRRLEARGMIRVLVSTGVGNTAAQHLYQSIGFAPSNLTLEFVKAI